MKTYDPTEVQVNVGALTLTGFASDTFVEISRKTTERYKTKVGAQGEVSRSKVSDKSGTIQVTLKHTSPCNAKLYQMDKLPTTFPITVIENGESKFMAVSSVAWIEKTPDPKFGVEEGDAVWVFACADLNYNQI